MAIINYTTVLSLTNSSNILLSNPSTPPTTFTAPALEDSTLTNMITGDDYLMTSSQFPTSPLPCTFTLNSVTGGFGATYGDSVYKYEGAIALADDYVTEAYLLVTTAIDAAILALPYTTGVQIAQKDYMISLRAQVDTFFNAANYSDANTYIEYIEVLLVVIPTGADPIDSSVSLTTASTATANVSAYAPATTPVLEGGWYNVITNTLTEVELPYTWNWDIDAGGSKVINNTTIFTDGVYTNYVSNLWAGLLFTQKTGFEFEGISYMLVTTTIDNQIQLFEDNYDPDNTAEAIALADLQSLQTQIAAAYAAEDYDLTNELIAQAQAILANGLSREISAALTSDADMNVFFTVPPAMPTGTYTTSTSTITNTLTGVAFTFDGFPLSASDLTQLLNSETLGFGADFPDGTYQIVVPFYVDGLLFTAECYLVVTTDWQCCIDKAAGKKCGKLNTALMQANLTNAVRIVALYSDVNTANALISEGNRECSSCGCGCS